MEIVEPGWAREEGGLRNVEGTRGRGRFISACRYLVSSVLPVSSRMSTSKLRFTPGLGYGAMKSALLPRGVLNLLWDWEVIGDLSSDVMDW